MANEQARQFIDQAAQQVQTGRFAEALEMVDRALALDPEDSEAYVIKGIALSNSRDVSGAIDAFQRAITLNPNNAKAFYNFAVHLYSLGEKERALEMARESLRLEPGRSAAFDLAARIERETGVAPSEAEKPQQEVVPPQSAFGAPPVGAYYRSTYDAPNYPIHSIAFIEKMGKWWDGFGYLLAVTGLISLIYTGYYTYKLFSGGMDWGDFNSIYGNWQGTLVVDLLFDFLRLLSLGWMVLELIDRRGNWLWIIPGILACCCQMNWLVIPLYILFGRERRGSLVT